MPTVRAPARSRTLAAVAACLVLAAVLRMAPLGDEAIDGDEQFSLIVSSRPLPAMLDEVRRDRTHPPLYYFVTRPVAMAVGNAPGPLRAVSIISGLALVAATAAAGVLLTGSAAAGALAGTLVAASDVQVHFSQQLRSYELYALLSFLAIAAFWWAMRAPERWGRWLLLSLATLAATQTHYLGWLFIAATGLPMLLDRRAWPWIGRHVAAMAPSLVAFVAWFLQVRGHIAERGLSNLEWIPPPEARELAVALGRFVALPQGLTPTKPEVAYLALGGLALAAALPLALAALRPPPAGPPSTETTGETAAAGGDPLDRRTWLLLLAAVLVPFALLLAPSALGRHIFVDRHLLPAQAFVALLLAVGAARLARTRRRLAVAAATLVVACQLAISVHRGLGDRRVPFDEAAAHLGTVRRGEPIVVASGFNTGRPLGWHLFPPPGRGDLGSPYALPPEVIALEQDPGPLPDRFWLAVQPHSRIETDELAEHDLSAWRRADVAFFPVAPGSGRGVEVALMVRR